MNPADFLRAILPHEGYYAIVRIKNKKVQQVLVDDINDVKSIAINAITHKADLYFGCAAFATDANRTKNNVQTVKSFWIDLDCGEGTPYATQSEGFSAVKHFCRDTGLPKPWVVNSGRGLHIYWPLAAPILAHVWYTYANNLVKLCATRGLNIKDPGCSTDIARILRVPDTFNYKTVDDPLPVSIVCTGEVSEWSAFESLMQSACGESGINGFHDAPVIPRVKMDAATLALIGGTPSNFKKIAAASVSGYGCAQIAYAIQNPESTSYNLWRAVLSIANVCEDRDHAIHKVSRGHPEYDYDATEAKAKDTGGPQFCETIARDCGAELCQGCKHKGPKSNPIQLGKIIHRVEENAIILSVPNESVESPGSMAPSPVILPELPFPYFRAKAGGIYRTGPVKPDGSPGDTEKVYDYNLDVIRRIRDPEKGETLLIHHQLPNDGIQEITMPLTDAQSLERMKDKLGFHGVAAGKAQMDKIASYMVKAVQHMQTQSPAEPAYTQMGWTDKQESIVWGRTLFTKHGSVYCPPSSKSATVAAMMKTSGSMQVWESIAARYGEPGFELYACCMLMALGSMLNPYTYEDPVWLHLVSPQSGTGKTTLTKVINSVWGDPLTLMLTVADTVNAVEKRRVIFNTIALCQDEITDLPPEKLSQIAYSQSQGREKHRLTSGSHELVNIDRRNNTFISNGNKYITDALSALKTNAGGEYARLIEIPFAPLKNKVTGDDHFGKIIKHYGHLGPLYADWLVRNENELQGRTDEARSKFEREFASVSSERNWVASTAAGFAAGKIIQDELGILKAYDLPRLYDKWNEHMHVVRKNTANQIVSHEHLIADFINENYANIIIPDAQVAAAMAASPATATLYGKKLEREARNRLVIRWERDTRMLYLADHELKTYCTKRSHSYADLLAHYMTKQLFVGVVSKRLGDSNIASSPSKALAFHIPANGGDLSGLIDGIEGA